MREEKWEFYETQLAVTVKILLWAGEERERKSVRRWMRVAGWFPCLF